MLPTGQSVFGGEGASSGREARDSVGEWVEIQRTISREKRDLALSRETLSQRIALMEREIEAARARIATAKASLAEAEKTRAALAEEKDALVGATASLADALVALESRTRELFERLPAPSRAKVEPLAERIPAAGEATEQTLARRFQNVVGLLNEVNKFQQDIAVTREVRELSEGVSGEVSVLYPGLGQAWFAGGNGTIAGRGSPAAGGWTWTPANEHAGEVAEAAAILQNERPARFVRLPAVIE